MLDFDKLQTPPGDGDILIEPPPGAWPGLIADNIRLRHEYAFTLAGEPAEVAIRETRAALIDAHVVACGHQPGFVHPGVWAKHVVVHQAAQAFGVEGLDFVVDNDAPASSSLFVPVIGSEASPRGGGHPARLQEPAAAQAEPETVTRREVTSSSAPAGSAYEGRPSLTHEQIETIRRQLSDLLGDRFPSSLMPTYLDGLAASTRFGGASSAAASQVRGTTAGAEAGRYSAVENSPTGSGTRDSVAQHLAGRLAVDVGFQADLPEARVSDAFGGLFLADLLLNPEPFAAAYNQALTDYRRQQDVRSPDRPLPNLHREADRTEAALWIYQPLQHRRRLWVRRSGDRVELFADAARCGAVSARDLARSHDATLTSIRPWVIRPRALTLTLWARLLACDLFVHGIGGAKYDRITDDIIRRYYRSAPPTFACVSATLRLPLPAFEATPQTLLTARRHLRDWHFNPQRYLSDPPADLINERSGLISLSERLRQAQAPQIERHQAFRAIRRLNDRLMELDPGRECQLRRRIGRIELELSSNETARSREFFYCLQPPERLSELAARLRQTF
jgi:hypothetical protein